MQREWLGGGAVSISGARQAAASPGLAALAGARAAKRESRVVARGRPSSHATRRSILIAAAMATCCMWVLGKPRYRVRRNPNARTRIVKIFELAFLLEVTPPTIAALHLVFRPPVTDTHRQYGW